MAKAGQHHNDAADGAKPRGHEKSKGNNNPSKSQTITTGSYKKPETYRQQAAEHRDPHKAPQQQANPWNEDIREAVSIQGSTRARDSDLSGGRSGSDSNASNSTKGH
jgi:hypothetical protein